MKRSFSTILMILVMLTVMPGSFVASAAPLRDTGTTFVRQISANAGVSFPAAGSQGADVSGPDIREIPPEAHADNAAGIQQNSPLHALVGRSKTREDGHGHDTLKSPHAQSSKVANSNPGLGVSFNGLNHRNQRLANGGNQFSIEPPDQGMCVGNGFVLETINDVMQVYDTSGNALTGVIDLNTFYGYPAQFDRTAGLEGPFVTDPSCYFDKDTQRWFHVVLTLEVDPNSGDFLGPNHLDLAVSTSSNPTGGWVVYRLPVQDDGTDGTPNHGCSLGPCIGDYPHMGADKYGFYLTTNEYSLFGPEFHAAQLYAFSKSALAANAAVVNVVQFDTVGAVNSHSGVQPGFTIWPAEAPAGLNNTQSNGTEYFMSSNAGEEASGVPGGTFSNEVILWSLTNSKSLNNSSPAPHLNNQVLRSEVYGIPPASEQKPGDFPLGQCINDTTIATPFGTGCWNLFFTSEPAHNEVISHLDSNDTRMQQVTFANGEVWGALDTVVKVDGHDKAGIAYFVIQPSEAEVVQQGYVALKNNNVNYPALSVLPNGKGIMAFTLVGQNYYPSAAYTSIDDRHGTGDIHVAAAGLGVSDGFSSYQAFGPPFRPRWGDYGAAVTDGNRIWIASEFIAQTCTLTQYLTGAIGSCGGTRTSLGNWATHISNVKP